MKLVDEYLLERIFDPLKVPERLNAIAQQEAAAGKTVERGPMGSVVLKLADGEVHFIPSGRGIECMIFAK